MTLPRPCSAAEAVHRARALLVHPSNARTGYQLGTGNYHPVMAGGKLIDVPWTETVDASGTVHVGSDCVGIVVWSYKLPRHRPGFNRGGAYDVEDDINCNSMLGDAAGAQDCFEIAEDVPLPGDVIAYPTFVRFNHLFIGHTALVVGTDRVTGTWDMSAPVFSLLDVVQIQGPNGRTPAARATDGSVFDQHDALWPLAKHRAFLLRVKP